ncbi:unnamed protein product [Cunninghamella echinulata]
MEQRIQKFHNDTKTIANPPTAKTVKQMLTLKKFIFKIRTTTTTENNISAFPLIEDALKVPCFTTKQKSQLLKWYDEILAKQEGGDEDKSKKKQEKRNQPDDEENYDDFDWDAFENEKDEEN